jgi:hypothetical protein
LDSNGSRDPRLKHQKDVQTTNNHNNSGTSTEKIIVVNDGNVHAYDARVDLKIIDERDTNSKD